jgi:hypothetical protein
MRSGGPGLLRRLLVRITPQFAEDWAGFVGELFRGGVKKIDAYNRDHAKIGEKVDEAPDMLWRAADGATSVQHAQAQAAYSQAENGRIDAELKKRTLEARTRHEEADAERAEAEAGVARVREIQARIELVQQLNAIGVKATLDPKALGAMHLNIAGERRIA